MADRPRIVTAAEMEKMRPQERADSVDASIIRSLDDVSDSFRQRVETRARRIARQVRQDA